jgi:hypothetical protein
MLAQPLFLIGLPTRWAPVSRCPPRSPFAARPEPARHALPRPRAATPAIPPRSERSLNPEGTHTQRWFLEDQNGNWHLAVIGQERDTRDGHYQYSTTDLFSRHALSCHSVKEVLCVSTAVLPLQA